MSATGVDQVDVAPLGQGKERSSLLNKISIELLPEHVAAFNPSPTALPPGSLVFLTHIAGKSLETQREAARMLKGRGYEPVPHLAAKNFRSTSEYEQHLTELVRRGVNTVLMIGGNPSAEGGEMRSAIELLRHPVVQEVRLSRVFFGGHPEGHPVIPEDAVRAALHDKIQLARRLGLQTGIVTQFGFDGRAMAVWAAGLLRDGIGVPIRFGVAGVTSFPRLIKFAMMCGVGASLTSLTQRGGSVLKAMREQDPSDVIEGLDAAAKEYLLHDVSLHFFPFGGWERTLAWVDGQLRTGR